MKQGILTTEFWLTILCVIISLVGLGTAHSDIIYIHITYKLIFISLLIFPVCSYIISRAMSKRVDISTGIEAIKSIWDLVDRDAAAYDVRALMEDLEELKQDIAELDDEDSLDDDEY